MPTATELHPVQTRIDEELLKRLDQRCDAERRSRAYVLEQALKAHLDREPATGKAA